MAQTLQNKIHKSFSLPKINKQTKQGSEQQQTKVYSNKKINKDIHKVKWSMAPKCLLQGHEGRDIIYVCINPACKEPTRLVCENCFFKSHKIHNQQFLAFDQIKTGEIQKLRYWPFEQKYKKAFEFVTKHESYVNNMIQDVNATFHGMAVRIISSIDKIRLSLLKKIDTFYIRESTKRQFCQKVKFQLQKCFQLKKIKEIVKSLFNKQIKHDIFLDQMNQILNNQSIIRSRQIFHNYFNNTEKGIDMFFDKMHFLKKENWIIEQIQEQKKTLRETEVTVDEAQIGIERILPQTIAYLDKCAEGHYPLTFQKKIIQDGSQYTGFFSKGVRTMFGMRKFTNGFTYYGQWRLNAKNGWGVYENKAIGYKFAGNWKQDKRSGFGKQQTITSLYEGNYVGDKKEGFGVFIENDIRYEITWKNDKKHGSGKKIQKNGQESEVYYINGLQSTSKANKSGLAINLKELTKRFAAKSIPEKTHSN